MPYTYDYPRPALTVDLVIYRFRPTGPSEILLIRREDEPFAGKWALPGGFVNEGEHPEEAAFRELYEETGQEAKHLRQVGAFAAPGRDPRGWTVSIAFTGRAGRPCATDALAAGDDAAEAKWCSVYDLPELAFDHEKIIAAASLATHGFS